MYENALNYKPMKLEDLKCEFCDGTGEREINIDGADCMCKCLFCNETGIDQSQLEVLIGQLRIEICEHLAVMHADGGHHTAKVGVSQSIKDASKVYYSLRAKVEQFETVSKEVIAILQILEKVIK